MVDWIHCNNCYKQPGEHVTFALANCGHIFCKECITKAPNQCRICKSKVNFIELSPQMRPEHQIYFITPTELMQRHFNEMKRVIDFQNRHRIQLINYMKEKAKTGSKVLQECNLLKHKMKEVEREIKELQEKHSATVNENTFLKQLVGNNRSSNVTLGNRTSSDFLLTPTSQTPPNDIRRSGDLKVDSHPMFLVSSNRISVTTPQQNGLMGTIPGRNNSSSSLFGSSPRTIPTPTSTMRSSMKVSPYNFSPRETSVLNTNSPFNRLDALFRARVVTPHKLISASSLRNM